MTQLVTFPTAESSHAHSLQVLESLYEFDDFMGSVETVVDMGCGSGLDLEWWATRTTRDLVPRPLNIKCTGIDLNESLGLTQRIKNVTYQRQNFEHDIVMGRKKKFDVVWCHDAFQYVINPFDTLRRWRQVMNPESMLCIIVPQTTNLEFNRQAFDQRDFVYHHWTIVNLIHVLAVSGFDCAGGFFHKQPDSAWLYAVVYNSKHEAMNPATTSWHHLAELELLPESVQQSLEKYGHVRQRDLLLPWINHGLYSFNH